MTIFKFELKRQTPSLIIWTGAISFMLVICMAIYPEMRGMENQIYEMFKSMGGFSQAFGLDRLNIGSAMGFYGVECGEILSLGGGFFAALIGISALSKEESGHTGEFLLTHPVTRKRVLTEKLLSVYAQILILNVIAASVAALSFAAVGAELELRGFLLFHLAFVIMQIEIASLCFGISAFIRSSSVGIGIGIACAFYFLNIISSISDKWSFLDYITPFAYTDAADIINGGNISVPLVSVGLLYSAAGIAAAYIKYTKKDISI